MLALITTQVDVTFFSYLELRPLLVTDDPPYQAESHVVSKQYADVAGQRALICPYLTSNASKGGEPPHPPQCNNIQ
jgi:hypothetical protein